ncbi:MAG: M15 family metallopeptidase [Burkholderiales bacterium]|nr:M15 family metallopeptidase [Burkholderiales bacterium]
MTINRRAVVSLALFGAPLAALAGKKGALCHPLFGQLAFETVDDDWVRGGDVRFTSGFDTTLIKSLFVPQIVGMPRSTDGAINTGNIQFHSHAHAQLLAAFEQIEQQGLLRKMVSFGGARFQPRLRKPVDGEGRKLLSRTPSNHSFGTAFDVNARDGKYGATARVFAAIFEANGFLWGGAAFNDPMHFEVKTFIGSQALPTFRCPTGA